MSDSKGLSEMLLKAQAKLELERSRIQQSYRDDFGKFAVENLSIKPKDVNLGYVPFDMLPAQRRVHMEIEEQRRKKGRVRCIILKSRQQGLSSYTAARTYWRTTTNSLYQSVVITHRADTTQLVFDMTRRFYDLQPPAYKPKLKSSNKSGMSFDGVDSSYHVYTAGSSQVGRGTTPTILHASEVAFWPNAEELLAGLFQGVANVDGTEIIIESTANGASGMFYDLWNAAHEKDSEWLPIFLPWFETAEYTSVVPEGFELTHDEDEYKRTYSLTDGQMQWRRERTAGGKHEVFKQEYPATAEEAFLVSGRSVFDTESIMQWNPVKPMLCEEYSPSPRCNFDPAGLGELETWEYAGKDTGYVIGADVSNGVGGDYSTACVMDSEYKIVALYRDNKINPGTFGELLFYLGRRYHNALIVCESNNSGMATINQLTNMNYPNMYYETKISQGSKDETVRIGFVTSVKSKPMLIGELGMLVRNKVLTSPSHVMRHEFAKYMLTEAGKMTAPMGDHDDTVIAAGLCCEGLRTHRGRLRKDTDWTRFRVKDETNWM